MEDFQTIYGPPGTGKTTELIRRMKQAVDDGIPEDRIGFVSFTKAAAKELAHRVGIAPGKNIATIHSMAFRQSGMVMDQIMNYLKLRDFSKVTGFKMSGANPEDSEALEDADYYYALYQLHHARNQPDDDPAYMDSYTHSPRPGEMKQFLRFCHAMNDYKHINGFSDFNDMLTEALDHPAPDVDILFVDESQDLSPLQWRLVNYWSEMIGRVHVAGDDDQSIYVWGGADPQGMQKWEESFDAHRRVLDQSFRIPGAVHRLADRTIQKVRNRVEKEYRPRPEEGKLRNFGDISQVPFKHGSDTMVLYRNHSLREDVETRLIQLGVPYVTDNGKPGAMHSFPAQAIRAWRNLCRDYEQMGQVMLDRKSMNTLLWNVKPVIKSRIERGDLDSIIGKPWDSVINASPDIIQYLKHIENTYGSLSVEPTVHLSTIHGSKGREADRVVLINGMTPRSAESMERDPDSEFRTFYVGITRAKHELDIVSGENAVNLA